MLVPPTLLLVPPGGTSSFQWVLWCCAAKYSAQTYNKLQRKGATISRDEAFYGIKADVSNGVSFYEHGWAYVSPEERAAKLKRGFVH